MKYRRDGPRKIGANPKEAKTFERMTIIRMSPNGAKYPLLTLARRVPGVVTIINNSDVIMNLKKIFQIKEADPPATPRIPPRQNLWQTYTWKVIGSMLKLQ